MGMSASQARLLTLNSRLSDLELSAQKITNSKQRLSVNSEKVSGSYKDALNKQKLTMLTSFNSKGEGVYGDLTYDLLTGVDSKLLSQYSVNDTNGNMLVTKDMATKFENSNTITEFLIANGVPPTIVYANNYTARDYADADTRLADATTMLNQTPEFNYTSGADLDRYIEDKSRDLQDAGDAATDRQREYDNIQDYNDQAIRDGQPPLSAEEMQALYDAWQTALEYRDTLQLEYNDLVALQASGGSIQTKNDPAYTLALDEYNAAKAAHDALPPTSIEYLSGNSSYYTNLYNKMQEGYVTTGGADEDKTINNPVWIQNQIMNGNLLLQKYSMAKGWEDTTVGSNTEILEDSDDSDVTKAEAEYEMSMNKIENKDQKLDLELKQIDTEHSAVQTEIDSVKKVIDKNIERTFKSFDA